ncbi:MAG: LytR/AlgR family response regulator transcription factor [Bacteroidales bacterium]
MNVIIIEDEQLAQDELARIINKRFPEMVITARLCSVKDSIAWLQNNGADLIFMDIQLSDGISFDIFDYVDVRTPIIFTTAYDQYAVRAFKVNGIGYLLKPIVESDLVNAVEKLDYQPAKLKDLLSLLKPGKEYKSRIAIKSGDRFSYINIEDVAFFYAEERVTFVMSKEGKMSIIDYTIETLEGLLDPKRFFRLTRGCIASIDSIAGVSKYFNSRLKVTLKPKYDGVLLISRVRVPDFLKWLDDV